MADEYLFISDCHLQVSRPDVTSALIGFLRKRAIGARHLYILGDLFEVWLGDDDPVVDLKPIIDTLQAVAQQTQVFFMVGNRDFLLGESFANRIGMTLVAEPKQLTIGNQSVLLMHGDSLCTDDHDYQVFRSKVRDPAWQSELLLKPLIERQQIAAQLRRDSAAAMTKKSAEIMDVNQDLVAQCFRQNQVNCIIHGHTHRPAVHRYPANLTRYVLGDWNPGPSYISWNPAQGFDLVDGRVKPD